MKKTYFIDKIGANNVNIIAESRQELESYAIRRANFIKRIYVHCSHVCTKNTDEHNAEFLVFVNNRKRLIYSKKL